MAMMKIVLHSPHGMDAPGENYRTLLFYPIQANITENYSYGKRMESALERELPSNQAEFGGREKISRTTFSNDLL